jgi:hypothetical protein
MSCTHTELFFQPHETAYVLLCDRVNFVEVCSKHIKCGDMSFGVAAGASKIVPASNLCRRAVGTSFSPLPSNRSMKFCNNEGQRQLNIKGSYLNLLQ